MNVNRQWQTIIDMFNFKLCINRYINIRMWRETALNVLSNRKHWTMYCSSCLLYIFLNEIYTVDATSSMRTFLFISCKLPYDSFRGGGHWSHNLGPNKSECGIHRILVSSNSMLKKLGGTKTLKKKNAKNQKVFFPKSVKLLIDFQSGPMLRVGNSLPG